MIGFLVGVSQPWLELQAKVAFEDRAAAYSATRRLLLIHKNADDNTSQQRDEETPFKLP